MGAKVSVRIRLFRLKDFYPISDAPYTDVHSRHFGPSSFLMLNLLNYLQKLLPWEMVCILQKLLNRKAPIFPFTLPKKKEIKMLLIVNIAMFLIGVLALLWLDYLDQKS